jgi:hypothetical protein
VAIEGANRFCGREPVTGVAANPVLIQSRFGQRGNFEVLVPLVAGGIAHYFRNNDDPTLPWKAAPAFGQNAVRVDALTMIQSNFGTPGNFEVIARIGERLVFFWRESASPLAWHGPVPLVADGVAVSGVTGNPMLIQSKFGQTGNFELVVPLVAGGIAAYWRDNDDLTLPWHGPELVELQKQFDALSLIQGNFGNHGNLEIVYRVGNQLEHSWRDSGPQFWWSGAFDFTSE